MIQYDKKGNPKKKPVVRMMNNETKEEIRVTADLAPIYERKGFTVIQLAGDHDALLQAQAEIAELKAMVKDMAKGGKGKADSENITPAKKPEGGAVEKLIARVKGSTEKQLARMNKELKLNITLSNYSEVKEMRSVMIDVIETKFGEK